MRKKKQDTSKQVPAASTPPRMSRRRRWLYRLLMAVVVPALLLGVLEGGLRLFGYGYPTAFFIRKGDFYQTNPRYGWRFFPRVISRMPLALQAPVEKPSGSYRIVILGSSAAQGFPDPNYSFSRYLEAMLRDNLPGRRFEVINAAMTAGNSQVMAPVAKDCAKLRPDLVVVYMGNNEVIGPFGAGTVLMGYSPSQWAIRMSLRLKTLRIGQLADRVTHGGGDGSVEWTGMRMFLDHLVPADDPRLQKVYDHFRRNLESICDSATGAGAEVLLCTVPVNLRQSAPFASAHRADLSSESLARWDDQYKRGIAYDMAGRHAQAIDHYAACLAIDDRFADLHFRLARCYLAAQAPEKAKEHFILARELDALRFRADNAINRTIRQIAESAGEHVRLLDAESGFSALAEAAGCPGEELFFEHVHPNYRGNYELARMVFESLVGELKAAGPDGAETVQPPPFERCCRLLALTLHDRLRNAVMVWNLTGQAPFVNQLDYRESRRRMLAYRESLWAQTESPADFMGTYREALAAAPEDALLRLMAARACGSVGDMAGMAEHVAAAKRLLPNEPQVYLVEARLRLSQGQLSEADRSLATYLDLMDHTLEAYDTAVDLLASCGHPDRMESCAREAMKWLPRRAPVLGLVAKALTRRAKYAEAESLLREAVGLDKTYAEGWTGLGQVQQAREDYQAAVASLNRAIELNPHHQAAYAGMGRLLFEFGRVQEAINCLSIAVDLLPDDVLSAVRLAEVLCVAGRLADGVGYLERALRIQPGLPTAAVKLAWILATSSDPQVRDPARALALAEAAMAAVGPRPQVMVSLAAAFAAGGQFDKAIEAANLAREGANRLQDKQLSDRVASYLEVYRSGKALMLDHYDLLEGW